MPVQPSGSKEVGDLRSLSDDELLFRLSELLRRSRHIEAELVTHIGEVDERRLYTREGSPSMFAYCTDVLHLSEHEAYLRITAARAAREHPMLLTMLSERRLHLSGIAKLAPHLTRESRQELLERAAHKSKRQIEELVAELAPRADAPPLVRKLPEARRAAPTSVQGPLGAPPALQLGPDRVGMASAPVPSAAAPRPALVQPLAPGRFKVQFTASTAFRDKLRRLQALMRSSVPDGDLAAILEAAVSEKLQRLEARRFGTTKTPRKKLPEKGAPALSSRYIPTAVRRAVFARDGGRCRYRTERGRRCTDRHNLEFHHVRAYARGGPPSPENLQLMCPAHNALLAERDFGRERMSKYRRSAGYTVPAP
jgi:hypothetical protein